MAYSADTRTLKPGDIFVPIKGKDRDGHDFIEEAKRKGASKILDVNLKEHAIEHRNKFKLPIIAVTGSSGKTTVKDMLAAVLSVKYNVLKTPENNNTDIGVPLTLLELSDKYDIAVVEMGMRGRGQIEYLMNIAQPSHAVITNVGFSHIGVLKTRDNIALAKSEVFRKGVHVYLNQNDEYYQFLKKEADNKESIVKSFMSDTILKQNEAAVRLIAKDFDLTDDEIAKGLANYKPSGNRLEYIELKDVLLINDCYNSNPDAVRFALEVLKLKGQGKKIVVLGDMLELGDHGIEEHKKLSVDEFSVVTVGELSKNIKSKKETYHFMKNTEAADKILQLIEPGATILIKGSRGMKMEEIVKILKEKLGK